MNKYYVYEYLRENGSPYYIGKGSGFRAYCKRPYKPKDKSRIKIIKDNLTEEEAFNLEINLIKQYGRQDLGTGILKNKTDGGEGCSSIYDLASFLRFSHDVRLTSHLLLRYVQCLA